MDPVTAGMLSFFIGIGVALITARVLWGVSQRAGEGREWSALSLVVGSLLAAALASILAYSIITRQGLYDSIAGLANYLLTLGGLIEPMSIPAS